MDVGSFLIPQSADGFANDHVLPCSFSPVVGGTPLLCKEDQYCIPSIKVFLAQSWLGLGLVEDRIDGISRHCIAEENLVEKSKVQM